MNNKLKHIVYCRTATTTISDPKYSIAYQQAELGNYAQANGLEIVDVVTEIGSAHNRKVFTTVIEKITTGEANAILVTRIDRLFRNPITSSEFHKLIEQGKLLQIATVDKVYRCNDKNDMDLLILMPGIAQRYSKMHSDVIKRGLRLKKERELQTKRNK